MDDLSFTENITQTTISGTTSLENIIQSIQSDEFKDICHQISQADKSTATQLKKDHLPIFNPCVRLEYYRSFNSNSSNESTGIVQFDIDECDDYELLIKKVKTVPELIYLFRSPSGGLKFGIATDFISNEQDLIKIGFKYAYEAVKEHVFQYATFQPDDAVKQIAQSCFLSHDPEAYINLNAQKLKVIDDVERILIEQEQEINQQKDEQYRSTNYNNVDRNEALKALSYIPTTFSYEQRLPINFAVISLFGDEAHSLLTNHWTNNNPEKLKKDIRSQINNFNGAISIGTLIRTAKEYGYKTTSNNSLSKTTTEPPMYNQKIYKVTDATLRLSSILDDFLSNNASKIVNFEAGAGKTKICIERAYEHIKKKPGTKIAFFVASHEIAEQYKKDFINFIKEKNKLPDNASEFRKKFQSSHNKFWLSNDVQHIKGRNHEGMCNHDLKKRLDKESDANEMSRLSKIFYSNISKVCLHCNKSIDCPYVQQFNGKMGNPHSTSIRIYTHDHLFNKRSLWDSGSYEDVIFSRPLERDGWIPTHIIVDEDIVGKSTGEQYIEKIDYSAASPLIKNIMHEMLSKPLNTVVRLYSSDIIKDYNAQKKIIADWHKKLNFDHRDTADSIIKKHEQSKKPKELRVLKALYKFAKAIDKKGCLEINCNSIYLGNNESTLFYADSASIHDRYKDIPTLLLDASANQTVVTSTFGKRFGFESISIEYQDNVKIYQCENKSFSKTSLNKDKDHFEKLNRFIKSKSKGKRFGLITYQNLDPGDGFGQKLADATEANEYGYFGNVRGINRFEDLDQLFIVGRHNIGWGFQQYFRQIFGGMKNTKDDINFDRDVAISNVYRMKSGKHQQVSQHSYNDRRMEALNEHFNKAETYQAIHRLRLIHGDKPKEVYILTNEVLDVTVDELFRSEKSKPASDERIKLIQGYILKNSYLRDKSNDICEATDLSASVLKNLKRNNFVERVLSNPDIEYLEIEAVSTKNRTVKLNCFIKAGRTVPTIELGLKVIKRFTTKKCS
jgi:hypothetical protein